MKTIIMLMILSSISGCATIGSKIQSKPVQFSDKKAP
jgi:uncharacterized protein YceK